MGGGIASAETTPANTSFRAQPTARRFRRQALKFAFSGSTSP